MQGQLTPIERLKDPEVMAQAIYNRTAVEGGLEGVSKEQIQTILEWREDTLKTQKEALSKQGD